MIDVEKRKQSKKGNYRLLVKQTVKKENNKKLSIFFTLFINDKDYYTNGKNSRKKIERKEFKHSLPHAL